MRWLHSRSGGGIQIADPVTMGLIGAATLVSVTGAQEEAEAAEQAAEFKAKTQMAAGTRKAAEVKRAGDILESDIRAQRAAGGGAVDPGAVERIGKVGAEAEYGGLSALYEGKQAADISIYEGKVAKQAAKRRGLSTLLTGGAGVYRGYKG